MTRTMRLASTLALLLVATGCGGDTSGDSDSPSADTESHVAAQPDSEETDGGTQEETDAEETGAEETGAGESQATPPDEAEETGERGTSDTPPDTEPSAGPEQTIDFPPPGENHVWPDNSVELAATASSGLPVEYRIEDDTGVCILEGTTLRVEQLGGCEVVASQPGNEEFDPAPEVARTYYVGGQKLRVQLEGLPRSASASDTPTVSFTVVVEGTASDTYSAQISLVADGDCSTDASEEIRGDASVEVTVDLTRPAGGSGTCTVNVNAGGQFTFSDPASETFTVEP